MPVYLLWKARTHGKQHFIQHHTRQVQVFQRPHQTPKKIKTLNKTRRDSRRFLTVMARCQKLYLTANTYTVQRYTGPIFTILAALCLFGSYPFTPPRAVALGPLLKL